MRLWEWPEKSIKTAREQLEPELQPGALDGLYPWSPFGKCAESDVFMLLLLLKKPATDVQVVVFGKDGSLKPPYDLDLMRCIILAQYRGTEIKLYYETSEQSSRGEYHDDLDRDARCSHHREAQDKH